MNHEPDWLFMCSGVVERKAGEAGLRAIWGVTGIRAEDKSTSSHHPRKAMHNHFDDRSVCLHAGGQVMGPATAAAK